MFRILKYRCVCYLLLFHQSVTIEGMKILLKNLVNFTMSIAHHILLVFRTFILEVLSPGKTAASSFFRFTIFNYPLKCPTKRWKEMKKIPQH